MVMMDTNNPDLRFWLLCTTLANAFTHVVDEGRFVSIKSEDLFSRSREHFDLLGRAVPIDDLGYEDFCASYAAPVNPKSDQVHVEKEDVGRRAERIPGLMDHLDRHGEF